MMEVTAYCPCRICCGQWADLPMSLRRIGGGKVPLGLLIHRNVGFVAGPGSMPIGTALSIPGYHGGQPVRVLDRGRLITSGRLDVFLPTHAQALKWGVQRLPVTIYYP